LFGSAGFFLACELLQELVACLFGLSLGGLEVVETVLLLGSVSSDHFVFVFFELLLASLECLLFFNGQDHVGLGLLFLLVLDGSELFVFLDHFVDNVVDLFLLG